VSFRHTRVVFDVVRDLRPSERLVLLCLSDRAGDTDGIAFPSVSRIMEDTELSLRSVRAAIRTLDQDHRGLIQKVPPLPGHRSCRYRVSLPTPPKRKQKTDSTSHGDVQNVHPHECKDCTVYGAECAPEEAAQNLHPGVGNSAVESAKDDITYRKKRSGNDQLRDQGALRPFPQTTGAEEEAAAEAAFAALPPAARRELEQTAATELSSFKQRVDRATFVMMVRRGAILEMRHRAGQGSIHA